MTDIHDGNQNLISQLHTLHTDVQSRQKTDVQFSSQASKNSAASKMGGGSFPINYAQLKSSIIKQQFKKQSLNPDAHAYHSLSNNFVAAGGAGIFNPSNQNAQNAQNANLLKAGSGSFSHHSQSNSSLHANSQNLPSSAFSGGTQGQPKSRPIPSPTAQTGGVIARINPNENLDIIASRLNEIALNLSSVNNSQHQSSKSKHHTSQSNYQPSEASSQARA